MNIIEELEQLKYFAHKNKISFFNTYPIERNILFDGKYEEYISFIEKSNPSFLLLCIIPYSNQENITKGHEFAGLMNKTQREKYVTIISKLNSFEEHPYAFEVGIPKEGIIFGYSRYNSKWRWKHSIG